MAASTFSNNLSCGIDWHKSSGGGSSVASFCCACASHFGRVVDASDRVAAAGEELRHRARAAGEVEQRLDRALCAQKELFDKVRALFVFHILGQLVIGRGESFVAVHARRLPFCKYPI